mmetsp:Transcript_13006/g.30964  ORF Transcript_13006/g.30964 Transcript_13006/m.30964 type:complete len:279 (-) Transcript_13006:912-1748(-)
MLRVSVPCRHAHASDVNQEELLRQVVIKNVRGLEVPVVFAIASVELGQHHAELLEDTLEKRQLLAVKLSTNDFSQTLARHFPHDYEIVLFDAVLDTTEDLNGKRQGLIGTNFRMLALQLHQVFCLCRYMLSYPVASNELEDQLLVLLQCRATLPTQEPYSVIQASTEACHALDLRLWAEAKVRQQLLPNLCHGRVESVGKRQIAACQRPRNHRGWRTSLWPPPRDALNAGAQEQLRGWEIPVQNGTAGCHRGGSHRRRIRGSSETSRCGRLPRARESP